MSYIPEDHPLSGDTRPTLSPSALQSYEICMRRGQFYHQPDTPRSNNFSIAVGSAYHAAMETWNLARMDAADLGELINLGKDAVLPAMKDAASETLDDRFTDTETPIVLEDGQSWTLAISQVTQMLDAWASAEPGERWEEPGIEVVATETEVWADLGSEHHIFHGVLDVVYRLDLSGSPTIVGSDYKTAGRMWSGQKLAGDPRALPQAPLYAEAWDQNNPSEPMGWFTYDVRQTTKDAHQRVWVATEPSDRAPFVQHWRDMSAAIAALNEKGLDMPTNPGHMLCSEKWCDYWHICPVGSAADTSLIKLRKKGHPL